MRLQKLYLRYRPAIQALIIGPFCRLSFVKKLQLTVALLLMEFFGAGRDLCSSALCADCDIDTGSSQSTARCLVVTFLHAIVGWVPTRLISHAQGNSTVRPWNIVCLENPVAFDPRTLQ